MPYYAYILISEKNGRHYYGSCEDLAERLKRHNGGKVKSTKRYKPFRVIYYEVFQSRPEARKRESYFKTINGYIHLKTNNII